MDIRRNPMEITGNPLEISENQMEIDENVTEIIAIRDELMSTLEIDRPMQELYSPKNRKPPPYNSCKPFVVYNS